MCAENQINFFATQNEVGEGFEISDETESESFLFKVFTSHSARYCRTYATLSSLDGVQTLELEGSLMN